MSHSWAPAQRAAGGEASRWPVQLALAMALVFPPAGQAAADEDKDLELIPPAAANAPAEAVSDERRKVFLENAFTQWRLRDGLVVPVPPPEPTHWQNRLLLDARKEWVPAPGLSLSYSGRFNVRAEDDLSFPTHESFSHDLREALVSWEAAPHSFLDAGRINLKSGVAAGFNPTDFFKTRAVVQPLTADPTVLREDRLGTLMVRAQHFWNGGAVTAAFAPGLYQPTRVYSSTELPTFNPMFDRTNAHTRALLKASVDAGGNLSPEVLLYREGSRTRGGLNLSASLGRGLIAYAEWAGGRRASLVEEAMTYAALTGTFPPGAPVLLPRDTASKFRNDAAAGLSWTVLWPAKITFNLEYHYHEAAFSGSDWRNWFALGNGSATAPFVSQQLWYIRAYALEQQEPLARQAVFVRFDWVDALIPKLELTGFVDTDLHDGSSLLQLTADYFVSNAWTVGIVAASTFGSQRSNFGSLPQAASVLIKAARYF